MTSDHNSPHIRLIVTDLDGTLLNSDHVISPYTENAIRDAMARGVLFTASTGKTFRSTTDLIQQFNITIPVICGNGTSIYTPEGNVLHENPIPREYAVEAIRMADAAGLVSVVYAGADLLVREWDTNVQLLVEHHEPAPRIVPNLIAALENDYNPHKLILMKVGALDAVAAFQLQLERAFAGRAQVLRSGLPSVVELLPGNVSKGTALSFLLDYLGIAAEQTICFGDNCNDLDMIRQAGIGVAMGHAPDDVRNGADYVTGTNDEDGVGHAIHKFVLTPHTVAAE